MKNEKGFIELRPSDLIIKEVRDTRTQDMVEVVGIKGSLGFDTGFIEECRQDGVRKYVPEDHTE